MRLNVYVPEVSAPVQIKAMFNVLAALTVEFIPQKRKNGATKDRLIALVRRGLRMMSGININLSQPPQAK